MRLIERAGLYSGLVAPWWWAGMIALCGSLWPHYDHTQQFISELGAHGSPTQTLMVWGGFYVTGLLYIAFGAALLISRPQQQRLAQIAAAIIVLAGIARLGTGFFPCEAGCNAVAGSIDHIWHHIFARVGYGFLTLATLLWSVQCLRSQQKSFALYSFVTVVVASLLLALLQLSIEPRLNTGLYQRLVTLVLSGWIFILSLRELRASAAP